QRPSALGGTCRAPSSHMRSAVAAAAFVLLAGCGGQTRDVSSGDGGGGGESASSTSPAPLNHRPSDAQCRTTAAPGTCEASGNSPFPCTSDPQCADAGPGGRCSSAAPFPIAN